MLVAIFAVALCILPVRSQIAITSGPPIGLGFGPTSTTPVENGVPIYTAGDQLWVSSSSQAAQVLNLTDPSGTPVTQTTIEPMGSVLLYTFSASDRSGNWTLESSLSPQNTWTIQIPLVAPVVAPVSSTSYRLNGNGTLAMNFTVASPTVYDISACVVGSSPPYSVTIPVPTSLGTGSLLLEHNGSGTSLGGAGQVTIPFTFWIELDHDYSYILGAESTIVTREVRAASSTAVPFPVGLRNETALSLQSDLEMRTGRYTLRAFFESASGLSAYETQILTTNDSSWIWLQGCTVASSSLTSSFSLSASLSQPTSQWPREIYVMYRDEGVEACSTAPIRVEPAAIALFASPWGRTFTNVQPVLISGAGIDGYSFAGNTIYLTGKLYPLQLTVSLPGGGINLTGIAQVPTPFSVSTLNMSSAKVVVTTLQGGKSVSGMMVALKYRNFTVARATSSGGNATFYVPPGNYTVVASFGGVTRTGSALGQLGEETNTTLDFGANPNLTYSDLLIATGGIGVVASVWVWVVVLRRRAGVRDTARVDSLEA